MDLRVLTVFTVFHLSTAKLGEYNPFVPARPGESPLCAKKGNSYCEYIQDYPVHIIGYLLERGIFDTNTLFKSEQDIKPPDLTNNRTSERRSYGQPQAYKQKPQYRTQDYRPQDLGRFHHQPFSNQIYRDYLNYYAEKQEEDKKEHGRLYFSDISDITQKSKHENSTDDPTKAQHEHSGVHLTSSVHHLHKIKQAAQGNLGNSNVRFPEDTPKGDVKDDVTKLADSKTPQYTYKIITPPTAEVRTLPQIRTIPLKKYTDVTEKSQPSPSYKSPLDNHHYSPPPNHHYNQPLEHHVYKHEQQQYKHQEKQYKDQDSQYKHQEKQYKDQDSQYKHQEQEYKHQEQEYRHQKPKYKHQDSQYKHQEQEYKHQEQEYNPTSEVPSTERPFIPSVYPTKEYEPPTHPTNLHPSTTQAPSSTQQPATPPSTPTDHHPTNKAYLPPARTNQPPSSGYLPPLQEQARPGKAYLSPNKAEEPSSSYLVPNSPSKGPSKTYLPPSKTEQPPSRAYLPPSKTEQPPSKSYLPPPSQSKYLPPAKVEEPNTLNQATSDAYLPPSKTEQPPHRGYLPPKGHQAIKPVQTYLDSDSEPPIISSLPPSNPSSGPTRTYGVPPPLTYPVQDVNIPALPPIDVFHAQVKNHIQSLHSKHSGFHDVIDLTTKDGHQYADIHIPHKSHHENPSSRSHLGNYHVSSNSHHGSQSHHAPEHHTAYKSQLHHSEQDYKFNPVQPSAHHQYVNQPHHQNLPKDDHQYSTTERQIDFSNREALKEALRTLKPENRVITLTNPPKLGRLERTKPSTTSTTDSSTSTTSTATTATTSTVLLTTSKVEESNDFTQFALGGNANDNFVFGPQVKQDGEHNQFTDDILRNEDNLSNAEEKGKIVPRKVESTTQPRVRPITNKINSNTIENSEIIGNAEVIRSENQFGHSYRVTTPSSSVYVQRTFGISSPFKREIDADGVKDNSLGEESSIYKSLQDAVDVLTRSSLGYVVNPLSYFSKNTKDNDLLLTEFEHFPSSNVQVSERRNDGQVYSPETGSDVNNLENSSTVHEDLKELDSSKKSFSTESNALKANSNANEIFSTEKSKEASEKEKIDKIVSVMKEIRELSEKKDGGHAVLDNEELNSLLVDNYLRQNSPEFVDESKYFHIHQNKANFGNFNEEENEIESLPSAVPQTHQTPLKTTENTHTPEVFHNNEEEITSSTLEQAQQGRSFDNSIHHTSLDDKILVPSFNNTVYIPKIADNVKIAVSPRTDLKLGFELNQDASEENIETFSYIDGPAVLEEPVYSHQTVHHLSVEPRSKRIGKGLYSEDGKKINTTFQDEWIGLHSNPVEELERKRRNQYSSEHEHAQRTKRDTPQEGTMLLHDDLSLARIEDDKQKYIQQDELTRDRRQSSDPDQLCPTVSQYIMPRAAVNSQGDWMYVVNMPNEPEFQQFVRSEICISESCRGLCSVPTGLSSKCSQQFVQKKLVALHPGGDKLVEDIFWFPSCCVCQVTQVLEL